MLLEARTPSTPTCSHDLSKRTSIASPPAPRALAAHEKRVCCRLCAMFPETLRPPIPAQDIWGVVQPCLGACCVCVCVTPEQQQSRFHSGCCCLFCWGCTGASAEGTERSCCRQPQGRGGKGGAAEDEQPQVTGERSPQGHPWYQDVGLACWRLHVSRLVVRIKRSHSEVALGVWVISNLCLRA